MPAPKRNLKPQTPGREPKKEQLPVQEGEEAEVVHVIEDDDGEITIKKSDLESLIAEMVDKQVEERVVSEVKAASRLAQIVNNPMQDKNLPDQKDLDATKISRAVLTRQGWVCPIVHQSDRLRMERNQSIPS